MILGRDRLLSSMWLVFKGIFVFSKRLRTSCAFIKEFLVRTPPSNDIYFELKVLKQDSVEHIERRVLCLL